MLKLYERKGDQVVAYHEAWAEEAEIVEHWGPLGQTGNTRRHKRDPALDDDANIEHVLSSAREKGFEEIDLDDHFTCLVEYPVDGMGNSDDLEKRHALEDRLNNTLGWAGLGVCDGGSIGSGSMEVCSFVVDFECARQVIVADLEGTEFADYSRIFDVEAEDDE